MPRWLYVALTCCLALPVLSAGLWRPLPGVAELLLVAGFPALLATAGVAEWRRRARVGRRRRNRCTACGYSLRESTGRCGECGHPVPKDHRRLSDAVTALERLG